MSALNYLKELKVMVGVPSDGTWKDKMAHCMVAMNSFNLTHKIGTWKRQAFMLASVAGSILPNKRLDIVKMALKANCSHVLFIDSDQTFPADTLARLLSHDKEIVAANIAIKRIPSGPTASKFNEKTAHKGYGEPVFTDENSHGLEKVWRVGAGIMLIDIRVFKATGLDIFGMTWRADMEKYSGEDWPMCEAFEKAGYDIWIDHDLSQQVGHIGDYIYTHDVVGAIVSEEQLTGEVAHG